MKKAIMTLFTLITVFMLPITASAAKENATCNIIVNYSSFVTPTETDTFKLTFKDAKENEQSFEFNAYDIAETSGSIELPLGVYTITRLEYIGDGYLTSFGYSIPTYFIVAKDDNTKNIEIAIGHEQIKAMYDNFGEDSILIYQGEQPFSNISLLYPQEEIPDDENPEEHPGNNYDYHNGQILGDDDNEEENIDNPTIEDMTESALVPVDEKAAADPDPQYSSSREEQTIVQEDLPVIEEKKQNEVVEQKNTTDNTSHRKSLIARVAILGILVILVAVLLLILKKQGKI